jgi:hypothetical protein
MFQDLAEVCAVHWFDTVQQSQCVEMEILLCLLTPSLITFFFRKYVPKSNFFVFYVWCIPVKIKLLVCVLMGNI